MITFGHFYNGRKRVKHILHLSHKLSCYIQVIYRMGAPEIVITDQGREFVNALSSNLYDITKTEHSITSAYHPQVTRQCYI